MATKATVINERDKLALEAAMAMARQEPDRAEQLDNMLKRQSWSDVAWFAASCCQSRTLRLKPWEMAPADAAFEPHDAPERRLLERMRDAGISQYDPDPLAALEQADRKKTEP